MHRFRLAVVASHPIQYQCPLYRRLARDSRIDLTVYFCCDQGVRVRRDVQFGQSFKWDIPLLEGFEHRFLKNWSWCPGPRSWGCINPTIRKELTRRRYDAVLIYGWMTPTNWLALSSGVPALLLAESPLNQELLRPRWRQGIKGFICRRFFRRIAGFLCIGTENKEFYRHYGVSEERLFPCPYAVDNDRFVSSYERWKDRRAEVKAELGIPLDHVVILFSGKLMEKKRPLDLLEAVDRLGRSDVDLVFVGDGELRGRIEREISARNLTGVHLVGFKNQTELPQYYAMADIFVLPSVEGETWGLVVNEAMCFHLPVVVSNLPGSGRDLVRNGENGFVFPARHVDALAECLSKLVHDPGLRRVMGEKSAELISHWGYEEDLQGIIAALEKVVANQAGCPARASDHARPAPELATHGSGEYG